MPNLWSFFQGRLWPLAIGMALAGVVALVFGPLAFGVVLALAVAVAIVTGLIGPETRLRHPRWKRAPLSRLCFRRWRVR